MKNSNIVFRFRNRSLGYKSVLVNQLTLSDPNTGVTIYSYEADGRLKTQVDASGNTLTNYFDGLNRLSYTTIGSLRTDYTYGSSGNSMHRLTKVKTGNNYVDYTHDQYGRIKTETRTVDGGGTFAFTYNYAPNGKILNIAYPGSVVENYEYDPYGNLEKFLPERRRYGNSQDIPVPLPLPCWVAP